MKSRRFILVCAGVAAVFGAAIGTSAVGASSSGGGDAAASASYSTASDAIQERRANKGKRGKRGKRGPAGPAGPPGAPGANGVGLNFNRILYSSESAPITLGNFRITAAADANGLCTSIKILAVSEASQISIGSGGSFLPLGINGLATIASGKSEMFTAVTSNGASTMSGIVGNVSVGDHCVVSGYVTGV